MKCFLGSRAVSLSNASSSPSFLHMTVGNFDGLHLGHQSLIKKVLENKAKEGGLTAVFSFFPHPRAFFNPQFQHIYLQDRRVWRSELAEAWKIDVLIEEKFTKELAETPAEGFLDQYFGSHLNLKSITVGFDFRFGQKRKGDVEKLRSWCQAKGIELFLIPPVEIDGVRVSTTLIRDCLVHGDLSFAQKYLGQPFTIHGTVARGDQKGRLLGFPTLNLIDPRASLLRRGVYLSMVNYRDGEGLEHRWPSITNVGIRPTIHDQSGLVIESHVLRGLNQTLYGEEIKVEFISFVREEMRFANLDELKKQIAADVNVAHTFFQL
jgi:riboflavin kinase/FMN adenylyltransferase